MFVLSKYHEFHATVMSWLCMDHIFCTTVLNVYIKTSILPSYRLHTTRRLCFLWHGIHSQIQVY